MYVHYFLTTDVVKHAISSYSTKHYGALASFPGHMQPGNEAMLALVQQKSN